MSMTTMREHTCDACGGYGNIQTTTEGENGLPPTRWLIVACPVCLGAGRISDVMPVADAVADAETLWTIADRDLPGLYVATDAGLWAEHWIFTKDRTGYRPAKPHGDEHRAANAAIRAARAAFRAVPGLRGE